MSQLFNDWWGQSQVIPSSVEIDPVNFENRFWNLFQSGELSDVTLIVGEKKERIKSHKVILAAASPVFKKYFTACEIKNELIISTVEPDVFRHFLKFVYTGEESFESEDVIPLMNAAKYYQVRRLVAVCEELLKNALTEQNALIMYQLAIQYAYGEKDLEAAAKRTVCRYAHKIIETDEFLEVSEECLSKLLREDDLTVKSEIQVFDALIRWAKAKCVRQRLVINSESCRSQLKKLIPLVRFPQMDEGDFAFKVVHGQIQVLIQEELLSVWYYHKIPIERRSEVPSGLFNCQPRRYIENVSFKIHVETLHGRSVTLVMTPKDTILNVKEKIEPNANQQSLTYEGQVLHDEQTLLDCNILKESYLQCLNVADKIQPHTPMDSDGGRRIKIQVRTVIERTTMVKVSPLISIEGLKGIIHSRTGLLPSKQSLNYLGVQLSNGFTLNDYNILNEEIIYAVDIEHSGH